MDGHYEGRIIFLLGRFVFVVVVGAFLSICTPQAQKVGTIDLKRSHYTASWPDRNRGEFCALDLEFFAFTSFLT